ncbi:MAG: hypothetical protein GY940_09420 [bacterium]|nr:hypothetical protein [bacterium]
MADIAAETLKVGNALASVRIDQMILNLAKGIAWGQYELDKVGVDITKMMGVPGTVSIGGAQLSMLDAGFVPSFYHFVDTILEMKMEVNFREEHSTSIGYKQSTSHKVETDMGVELSAKMKVNALVAGVEMGMKAHYNVKSTSAFASSLDTTHAQKFSQDLSASSLMRTKIVPVPPPAVLVERINILLEQLRGEAKDEEAEQGFKDVITFSEEDIPTVVSALNGGNIPDKLKTGFIDKPDIGITITDDDTVSVSTIEGDSEWLLNIGDNAYRLKKVDNGIKVYKELKEEEKKGIDEIILDKVADKLLGVPQDI